MQQRHQNPLSSGPIKTVFYARRSPSEPPILVSFDLQPYVPSSEENVQYVQLLSPAPAAQPQYNPQLNTQYPQLNESISETSNHPQNPLMNYAPQNSNAPANQPINGFSLSRKVLSIFFILCNIAMVVSAMTMTFLALLVSTKKDEFTISGDITKSIALSLGIAIIAIRIILITCTSWNRNIKTQEKISIAMNCLMPSLKYHIIRLNPSYQGKILSMYNQDIIVTVYEFVVGLLAISTFTESYNRSNSRKDPIWLLLGVFCLINSMFVWPVVMMIHRKWTKPVLIMEKQRRIFQMAYPHLQHLQAPLLQAPIQQYQQQRNDYQQPFGNPQPQNLNNYGQIATGQPVINPYH